MALADMDRRSERVNAFTEGAHSDNETDRSTVIHPLNRKHAIAPRDKAKTLEQTQYARAEREKNGAFDPASCARLVGAVWRV
jgi:hypothetical protein